MTHSQQLGKPATGATVNTPNRQYTTNTPSGSPTYTYPNTRSTGRGMSAQPTGPAYPGVVGPTGSGQPDAANAVRSMPSGGGGMDTGGGASGAGAGGAGSLIEDRGRERLPPAAPPIAVSLRRFDELLDKQREVAPRQQQVYIHHLVSSTDSLGRPLEGMDCRWVAATSDLVGCCTIAPR